MGILETCYTSSSTVVDTRYCALSLVCKNVAGIYSNTADLLGNVWILRYSLRLIPGIRYTLEEIFEMP